MTTETAVEQEFKLLGLDLIEESKTNPRKTFEAKALQDLAASIKEQGVIVPILVRPMGPSFELVDGARRFRAAKMAKLDQIPAIIRMLGDTAALEAQVIANLQRADVHPLEEAEGFKALIDKHKYDPEMIAAKIGKSESHVYQRIQLLKLIEPAKKAFLADTITAGHAVELARLQPNDQQEALGICTTREYLRSSGSEQQVTIGIRALRDWIKTNVLLSLDGAPWKKDDAKLVPKAGTCDACPKRSGNAPGLWPDVERPKVCTDRFCFQLKLAAHMANQVKELEASGSKVVKIVDEYYSDEKGVLGTSQYHKAAGKKRCDKTVTGFYVEGEKRGKTTDICIDAGCRIHKPKSTYSSGSSSSDEGGKERERRIIKERATERARHEIFRQVIQKTKSLGRQELEILALNGHFGLPYAIDNGGWIKDLDGQREVEKASDEDLSKFLLGVAIGHQQLGAYQDADILYRAAALRKLDVKAIEQEAARQVAHERMHHARRMRWKGSAKSQAKAFDALTCRGCGRTDKEKAKGGWHWAQMPSSAKTHTNAALCNDCEHEENLR